MPSTRRSALRVLGTALVGAVAGCTGADDTETPTDRSTATATRSATPTDTPTEPRTETATALPVEQWTDWTPAPGALGIDGAYAVLSLRPSEIASYAEALPATATEGLESNSGLPGLGPLAALDRVTVVGNAVTVFAGPTNPERIRAALADRGLTSSDRIGGLTLHTPENGDRTVAVGVGAGVVVAARTRNSGVGVDGPTAVRAVVDRTGARLPDAVPAVGTVREAVGAGAAVALRANTEATETVEGAASEGYRWGLGADETRVTAGFVGDVTTDAVTAWANDSGMFGSATPSVSASSGVVTAVGAVPTGEVSGFTPDWKTPETGPSAPAAAFGFDYDSAAGIVTVTHEGGDTIAPERLTLGGSGFADRGGATQTAPGPWQGTVSDGGVAAGDAVTVGVTPSYELRVVWRGESESATLALDRA